MSSKLNTAIETVINEYLKVKYDVSLETLLSSWKKGQTPRVVEEEEEEIIVEKKVEKKEVKKETKKTSKDKPKCIHPIARGDNKGQPCGVTVSDDSKTGHYCKKHLSQEEKPEKVEKKEVKKPVKKEEQIMTKQELKEKIDKRTTEIEVRRNKFGNYEHQGSGLVLDRTSGKVYGKQNSDGSIEELTEEDIELCKSIGFKFVIPETIKTTEQKESDEEEDDDDLDLEDDDDEEDDE